MLSWVRQSVMQLQHLLKLYNLVIYIRSTCGSTLVFSQVQLHEGCCSCSKELWTHNCPPLLTQYTWWDRHKITGCSCSKRGQIWEIHRNHWSTVIMKSGNAWVGSSLIRPQGLGIILHGILLSPLSYCSFSMKGSCAYNCVVLCVISLILIL